MRELETQDICRVEIFPVINGYHAGVCRTARVGRSPAHADDIWKNLVECKYLIMEMIKPGASSREVYQAFIDHLGKLKLPPIKFVGHGIGLHLHEEPYLGMYSDVPLEAGMVLGIEPLVYNTGHGFGMQNKDVIMVTESGCELLSDYTDTDTLLTVG
jgi:Xaa-Pro aminopeptidase